MHGDAELARDVCTSDDACPLRGLRCAELATGDFIKIMEAFHEKRGPLLMQQLPRGLSDEEQLSIMQDFEKARAHLVTTFIVKTAHRQQAPFCVFGMGHADPANALAR